MIVAITEPDEDIVDEHAVPLFNATTMYDIPDSQDFDFRTILDNHKEFFCNIPGKVRLQNTIFQQWTIL